LRSTSRTLAVLVSLLAVLALSGVAAGATVTQNSTPKKWVSTFCSSLVTWEQTVKSSSIKLSSTISTLKKGGKVNIPVAKGKLVSFLGGLVKSTDKLIGQVKAVGAPSVKNGSKIQKGVLDAFGQIDTAFKHAKKAAQKLSTDNAQKFSKGALAVAATITASGNQVAAAFTELSRYSTKSLDDAARKDPACARING